MCVCVRATERQRKKEHTRCIDQHTVEKSKELCAELGKRMVDLHTLGTSLLVSFKLLKTTKSAQTFLYV